jgi:hypothetical protein
VLGADCRDVEGREGGICRGGEGAKEILWQLRLCDNDRILEDVLVRGSQLR